MSTRTVAIIGAGMGGLAAGVYGRLAGLETTIFEMHDKPGGLCTAWTRKGYTFDGCIHHLAGCLPGTPTHRMWEELGAMPREVLYPADLTQVEVSDVATPLTTERYTGVGPGFASSPRWGAMMLARPMAVSGVQGLRIVGQSAGGAGIPGCAVMGRNAVRAIR